MAAASQPAETMPRALPPLSRPASVLRRRCVVLAGVLGPWLGAGCTPPTPLRLAGHPWPGYEPLFLARALGYLPASPLLQLQETASPQESVQRLRESRVDGAMLTLDEVLQLRDQGLSLQIVLVFDVSRGADVLLARPGLRNLPALRGQRIGVDPGSPGPLMLHLVLEQARLQIGDVQVLRIPYADHEQAWASGAVDALVTNEPQAIRLQTRGAHMLLSTRQLPDAIFNVLALRKEALQPHAESLRAVLAAYFQALDYQRRNPWEAAYRMAPRLEITAEAMLEAQRGLDQPDRVGNQRYLLGYDSTLQRIALQLSPLMQRASLLRQPVSPRELVSGEFLPRS